MPVISIILPFYNRHGLIRETIESVIGQSLSDFEVIVVDDGSIPRLQRSDFGRGSQDPRIIVIRQQNGGSASARNAALRASRGQYVLFLDSDDLMVPGALQALWERAHEGDFDAVVGNWTNFSADGPGAHIRPAFNYGDALANVVEGEWATGSAILKRSLDPVSSEDKARVPWELAEAYQRALSGEKVRIAYVDHDVVMMRQDSGGRLTISHDHFEPLKASRFWRHMKSSFPLNNERRSAFDHQLFRYTFTLFHAGRYTDARDVFSAIDADRMHTYHWYRLFSPAWFARWCGVPLGLKLQRLVNHTRRTLVRGQT